MVDSDEKLAERVTFIHERIGTAAIAEQYIEGREIYVGVLGNDRLRVLPVWELEFGDMPDRAHADRHREGEARPRITRSAAASSDGPAKDLSPELRARIAATWPSASAARSSSTAMRASTSGSSADGTPYFIEANPNPEIAQSEEFATAAKHDGLAYRDLLNRILALGISRTTPARVTG